MTSTKRPYRVWWTSQVDCEAIGDPVPAEWPCWLQDQYISRVGRPGHGRLWVSPFFPGVIEATFPDPPSPLSRALGLAAGIVITPREVPLLWPYPGVITDLNLNRVSLETPT